MDFIGASGLLNNFLLTNLVVRFTPPLHSEWDDMNDDDDDRFEDVDEFVAASGAKKEDSDRVSL